MGKFKVGDKVYIKVMTEDEFKKMDHYNLGWVSDLQYVMGNIGIITNLDSNGNYTVKSYCSKATTEVEWDFPEGALSSYQQGLISEAAVSYESIYEAYRKEKTILTCPIIQKKCTCGTDSVGGGNHSSWCDKA